MALIKRKVFVTGMGCVTAAGNNCGELLSSLRNGRTGIGKSVYFNSLVSDIKIAAEIRNPVVPKLYQDEQILRRIRTVVRRKPTRAMELAISSILETLLMAKVPEADLRAFEGKTGLVVGGSNLTQNTQYMLHERFRDSPEYVQPKYALEFFDTNYVGVLSEIFGVESEGFSVGGASASGNVAVLQAYRLIAYGIVDTCILVSPIADFSPFELQAFKNLGVFGESFHSSPELACRPFDKRHEGFVLGQGSGAILLESAEHAKKRGVDSLGEILGGVIKLDGNHLSDAKTSGEQVCMEQALLDTGISAKEIDYINAHGTSTPQGDRAEALAIAHVFAPTRENPWINSSKSIIGHCMFSAGLLETITTLLQMKHNFVHPNLNIGQPIEECEGLSLVRNNLIEQPILMAMNNSFGFGGINTSVILKNCVGGE